MNFDFNSSTQNGMMKLASALCQAARSFKSSECGASIVESALSLSVFLAILLGFFHFGHLAYHELILSESLDEMVETIFSNPSTCGDPNDLEGWKKPIELEFKDPATDECRFCNKLGESDISRVTLTHVGLSRWGVGSTTPLIMSAFVSVQWNVRTILGFDKTLEASSVVVVNADLFLDEDSLCLK